MNKCQFNNCADGLSCPPRCQPEFKKDDKVYVNEISAGGKLLPHDWYGTIADIDGEWAMIKDESQGSYKNEKYQRRIKFLELR